VYASEIYPPASALAEPGSPRRDQAGGVLIVALVVAAATTPSIR